MNLMNHLTQPIRLITYLSDLYGRPITIGKAGPVSRNICERHKQMTALSVSLDDKRSNLNAAVTLIDEVRSGTISCAKTPKLIYLEHRIGNTVSKAVCSVDKRLWSENQNDDITKMLAIVCLAIEQNDLVREAYEKAVEEAGNIEEALNTAYIFCDTFLWEFADSFEEFKEFGAPNKEQLKTAFQTGHLKDVSCYYHGPQCSLFQGLEVRYPEEKTEEIGNEMEGFLKGDHFIHYSWEKEQESRIRPITFMDDYVAGESFYKVMKKIDLRIGKHMVDHINNGRTDPLDIRRDYVNMLFYGDPGTGKTALANAIAAVTGMPIYEVTMNEDSEDDEVEGKNKIVEGQLSFVETAFLEGFTKGGIILLEEINLARPNVFTSVLNQAMEYPYMVKKNGYERITRHPMAVIIGTMNLETEGTMALNSASSQRFTSKYLIEEMSDQEMIDALKKRGYKAAPVRYVYNQYKKLRKNLKESEQKKKLLREISIRQCIDALNAIEEGVNPREAVIDSMYGAIAVKNKKIADNLKAGLFDTMPDYRS